MLDLTVTTRQARVPVTVVTISGDIDSSNFQVLQSYLDDLIAKGTRHVLLNLRDAKRITSAGLRVIHNVFNSLRALNNDVSDDELRRRMSAGEYKSPHLKLTNLTPHIIDVFRLGGFDIYLDLFENVEEAVNAFGQDPASASNP
jgi:anti-anti-sigma factor